VNTSLLWVTAACLAVWIGLAEIVNVLWGMF